MRKIFLVFILVIFMLPNQVLAAGSESTSKPLTETTNGTCQLYSKEKSTYNTATPENNRLFIKDEDVNKVVDNGTFIVDITDFSANKMNTRFTLSQMNSLKNKNATIDFTQNGMHFLVDPGSYDTLVTEYQFNDLGPINQSIGHIYQFFGVNYMDNGLSDDPGYHPSMVKVCKSLDSQPTNSQQMGFYLYNLDHQTWEAINGNYDNKDMTVYGSIENVKNSIVGVFDNDVNNIDKPSNMDDLMNYIPKCINASIIEGTLETPIHLKRTVIDHDHVLYTFHNFINQSKSVSFGIDNSDLTKFKSLQFTNEQSTKLHKYSSTVNIVFRGNFFTLPVSSLPKGEFEINLNTQENVKGAIGNVYDIGVTKNGKRLSNNLKGKDQLQVCMSTKNPISSLSVLDSIKVNHFNELEKQWVSIKETSYSTYFFTFNGQFGFYGLFNKQQQQNDKGIPDLTPPNLTLKGANPLTVNLGGKFKDPGATAKDNIDGDLTNKITVAGKVDTTKLGQYTLTYTVTDRTGNTASATRLVKVTGSGGKLPDTATNQWNWIAVGSLLILIGTTILLLIRKRKKTV